MTIALLVIGNGRLDYLHQTVDAALTHLPEFDHYLMIDDSGDEAVRRELKRNYGDFLIWSHIHNQGMAKAVQAGFDEVLKTDADFVFWLEEDMLLLKPLDLVEPINVLHRKRGQIAQMLFQRQPLTPDELASGSVAQTLLDNSKHGRPRVTPDSRGISFNDWIEQDAIFSLNPCLIPRNVLELGWDTDNERGMTKKLLDHGFTFGCWHGQYVEHIGHVRGAKWQL